MLTVPPLDGLGWSKVRAVARELAGSASPDEIAATALPLLDAPEARRRMLAVYLLGFTAGARPANLELLRERAVPDPDWEVQEALAQACDAYCAAVGYEAALPEIATAGWRTHTPTRGGPSRRGCGPGRRRAVRIS